MNDTLDLSLKVLQKSLEMILDDRNRLLKENKQLKEQIKRELDDNNGLRENITKQFHEIQQLKELQGGCTTD